MKSSRRKFTSRARHVALAGTQWPTTFEPMSLLCIGCARRNARTAEPLQIRNSTKYLHYMKDKIGAVGQLDSLWHAVEAVAGKERVS